jgi:hypothetical protein
VSPRNALLVIEATWHGQPLPQATGPTVPFYGSDDVPGSQDGDYAGRPGSGFARVLEGRINDQGLVVRPVLFIDGEAVVEDTLIPSGATDVTEVVLAVPPGRRPATSGGGDALALPPGVAGARGRKDGRRPQAADRIEWRAPWTR